MTQHLRFFALCLFTLFALVTNSGYCEDKTPGVIEIDHTMSRLALDDHLLYLRDLPRRLDLDEVLDLSNELPWVLKSQDSNTLVDEGGLYWFRITLINTSEQPLQLLAQTKYPLINVADLYTVDSKGRIKTIYADSGLEDKFSNRPVPHHHLINDLKIPAKGTITLIWRIDSEPLLRFSASLWEPSAFVEWDMEVQLIHGLLYGMLLIMALYNLVIYFSTWQRSYFFYVAYVASTLYLIAAQQGHVYQYIAPDEVWAKLAIFGIMYVINTLMFCQFTLSFLELRKHSIQMLWLIRALAWSAVALLFAVMITNNTIVLLAALMMTALLYLAALIAGVLVRKQGVISAGYFVIAILVLAFAIMISNMASLGMLHSNEMTENLTAIGTTLMLVFLSLALADRINQLQKEINDANKTILKANEEKMKAEGEMGKLKNQRTKLEQASSQAKLESRSKSDFLATLSHEIQVPIHNMLNMAEQMKVTRLDEQQTHYLNSMEQSGKSMLRIACDLQDFAQIEAGKTELQVSSFNLESLIDDCISTFALRAKEKNVSFIADLDSGINPVLRGDVTKLQQIILNLLSNAFKFTDQGNIVLTVRSTDKPAVNGIELHFEVQDSGIGLTEEERQRLFTPFQQADQSTYGRYGGSGLGLAISKQLAELMDGRIGVSSEPGVGSRFWFTARLIIDEHPPANLVRRKSPLVRGKKLLLVDPNPVTADVISRLLRSWQMKVEHCSDMDTAIEAARLRNFDVILSDYDLQPSNGINLAKKLRESGYRNQLILMISGKQLTDQHELLDTDIELLLEKPITYALLHDALKRALNKVQELNSSDEQRQSSTGLNVLVVEDNQVNQMVIKGLLGKLDIIPDIATNGLEALSFYDKKAYDLILMDCEMPEMDGYEASAQIRTRERQNGRSHTPIIALTAHARSDYHQRVNQSGMDGYLTKPVTLSELSTVIEGHLVSGNQASNRRSE